MCKSGCPNKVELAVRISYVQPGFVISGVRFVSLTTVVRAAFGFVAAAVIMISVSASAAEALAGDPVKGKEIYVECAGCHDLKENRIGPRHCGVVGRKAASLPDFPGYSQAMKE